MNHKKPKEHKYDSEVRQQGPNKTFYLILFAFEGGWFECKMNRNGS